LLVFHTDIAAADLLVGAYVFALRRRGAVGAKARAGSAA